METFFSVPEQVIQSSSELVNCDGRFEIWTYDKQFIYRDSERFFLNHVEPVGWRHVIAGSTDRNHFKNLSDTAAPLLNYFSNPGFEYSYLMTNDNIDDFENSVKLLLKNNKQSVFVFFKEQDTLLKALDVIRAVYEKYKDFRLMFSYDHGVLLGLVYGKPVVPPKRAVIEIHDDCNLKCEFCWTHSPLLEEGLRATRKKAIDVNMFYKYVDELASAPVELVELCAVGDPLYHPNVWEMIHYIKQKGLRVRVSTNATLINKRNAEDIIRWGVDELAMNISGGDPETYAGIHNVSNKLFENLKKNLCYLSEMRKKVEDAPLLMNHINVLTERNARAIPGMIRFAEMTGANSISFRAVWPHRAFLKQLDFKNETILHLISELSLYKQMVSAIGIDSNLDFFEAELLSVAERRGLQISAVDSYQQAPSYSVQPPQLDNVPQIVQENYAVDERQIDPSWVKKDFASPFAQTLYDKTVGFRARNEYKKETQPVCAVGYHFTLLGSDNNLRFCCRGDKTTEKYSSIKEQWTSKRYQSFRSSWRQAYKDKKSLCVGCPHVEENHRYSALLHQHGLTAVLEKST
ncbi:MAG: radical SAM protein [Bdellovibrionaceae bacterium]|nr:radical SAM protein [Pseudobdellovibrionaceae bacterium]